MKLTKTQKEELIELLKMVDVRDLEIDVPDEDRVRWFRFGSHNGLQIAIEIIKAVQEKSSEKTVGIVD